MRQTLLPLSLIVLIPGIAAAQVIIRCEPSEIRQWPHNSTVEISASADTRTMKATNSFYGVSFETVENVLQITTATQAIFQGDKMKLTIDLTQPAGQANATLETEADGKQDLICM